MVDEKHAYEPEDSPPIPTYEEATSSHPVPRLGPQEVSDDAERQGLLGREGEEMKRVDCTHIDRLTISAW